VTGEALTGVKVERPLAGRVALVTGAGRPRGMGRAIALRLAQAGAKVVVADLGRDRPDLQVRTVGLGDSTDDLEETAHLARAEVVASTAVSLDITDADEATAAVQTAVTAHGGLDILVNNAGTAMGVGEFCGIPDEAWEISWRVNVLGTVRMCRAAIPYLEKGGHGAIINVASTQGIAALPNYGAYTVAKHATVGLTRLLAAECGPRVSGSMPLRPASSTPTWVQQNSNSSLSKKAWIWRPRPPWSFPRFRSADWDNPKMSVTSSPGLPVPRSTSVALSFQSTVPSSPA
jgi:NAD(P)-dependent dehydrogenase (short-subunit alcohol dehydrogenase family)